MQSLNPTCVELAVRTALALNSQVQSRSTFDRKHYFYSDLPAGYQITQRYGAVLVLPNCGRIYSRTCCHSTPGERRSLGPTARRRPDWDHPDTARTGMRCVFILIFIFGRARSSLRLSHRPLMSAFQDTAKSIFDARRRLTLVDLNRAGAGLMEIVSDPDMRCVCRRVVIRKLDAFRSPEEAADYVRTLQAILRAVGASDGNMELASTLLFFFFFRSSFSS
jgi:aspartyl-tRNA(Asn)/glutamyl-tRNA(Gln) amidotransferase subunit B